MDSKLCSTQEQGKVGYFGMKSLLMLCSFPLLTKQPPEGDISLLVLPLTKGYFNTCMSIHTKPLNQNNSWYAVLVKSGFHVRDSLLAKLHSPNLKFLGLQT